MDAMTKILQIIFTYVLSGEPTFLGTLLSRFVIEWNKYWNNFLSLKRSTHSKQVKFIWASSLMVPFLYSLFQSANFNFSMFSGLWRWLQRMYCAPLLSSADKYSSLTSRSMSFIIANPITFFWDCCWRRFFMSSQVKRNWGRFILLIESNDLITISAFLYAIWTLLSH